jgi:hypothetical protein
MLHASEDLDKKFFYGLISSCTVTIGENSPGNCSIYVLFNISQQKVKMSFALSLICLALIGGGRISACQRGAAIAEYCPSGYREGARNSR